MTKEKSIPEDWEIKTVEDVIASAKNGGTPKRSNSAYWDGEIDWLSSGEVDGHEIRSAEENITKIGLKETSAKLFPADSVLVAMYGDGKTKGQSAVLKNKMSGNQAICCLKPDKNVIKSYYLSYYFKSIKSELVSKARGAGQDNLNQQILIETEIPVPSLEEQEKIVEYVYDKLQNIGNIFDELSFLESEIDEYEEAMMSYILIGRSKFSSGAVAGIAMESDLPKDWELLTVDDITEKIRTGGTPRKSDSEYWDGTIPWRGSKHFNDRSLSLNDTRQFITKKGKQHSRIAESGDVLVVCRGAHTGKIGLVENKTAFNQDIKVLRTNNSIKSEYLAYYLMSLSNYFDSVKRGGTTKGIVTSDISELNIPVPPIKQQKSIINKLEKIKTESNISHEKISILDKLVAEYRNSVLHHAFHGKIQVQSEDESDINYITKDDNQAQYTISDYRGDNQ